MDSYPGDFPFGIMDVVELLHLRIRRRQANSVYVDCPFCGDRRGKMNVNFVKNVWRCNYCDEHGGMLALYARLNNTTTSDAYWEIGEALCNDFHRERPNSGYEMAGNQQAGTGSPVSGTQTDLAGYERRGELKTVQQAERASGQEIHQTLSLLLAMLPLQPAHRNHLHSPKRGLSDEQIDRIGFKSTPPPFLCRAITERLMKQGCKVEGVPGFYLDDSGRWTMNFYRKNAGILIPAVGYDGMIHGLQILLDSPLKQKDDPPDKSGAKYIWFSSSSKNMGVTSGSPVHFIGNPSARVVYVIEGLLKADISHCLTNRTFAAIAGANNTSQLDTLFALLAQNGTEEIIEAHDMDKYSNQMTSNGASKIYLMARKNGMACRRLTWNPNYKGFDDWQLALREKEQKEKEVQRMNFKQQYLCGKCDFTYIDGCVELWHTRAEKDLDLTEYLGLTKEEYQIFLAQGNRALKDILDSQRVFRRFCIYQLCLGETQTVPFAFKQLDALRKAGYEQPPAAAYQTVWSAEVCCPKGQNDMEVLGRLFLDFNEHLPEDYRGRPLAPSDVVELDCQGKRTYADADYMVMVPSGILDIITEGRALHHCAGSSDRYWDRIERRESFVMFLRKTADPFHAYYTLEVEPDGTVRQKRTEYDRQKKDIEQATEFLQKWQRVITARLTESDKALAAESRILREKEFIQLKKDRVIIHTGHLAGKLLVDVLMADLMENTDSIQSPALAAAA